MTNLEPQLQDNSFYCKEGPKSSEPKKSTFETLGDRLKNYESQWESSVPIDEHIVIRIDGHKFSKFTMGFKRPFDEILSTAMEQTTKDLLQEFHAVVGYTESDEITLVIPFPRQQKVHYNKKVKADINHPYNGRVQKIASLTAGFATMAFNRSLSSLILDQAEIIANLPHGRKKDEEISYYDKICGKKGSAWFDARVYSVPNDIEAFNSVLWRVRDAEKNSRSMWSQAYCKHSDLHKMTGKEQVEFCLETTGNDWHQVDDRYKYGILVKKETYMKGYMYDKLNGDTEEKFVERTRIVSFSTHLTFSDENVKMIMAKKLKGN